VYDTLRADGANYVAREASLPRHSDVSARFHFALEYRRDAALQAFGEKELPDPHAMSGSLVWNTRFVETTLAGTVWSPTDAVVTGAALVMARRAKDRCDQDRVCPQLSAGLHGGDFGSAHR
jgi:hypothetical protein